MTDGLTYQHKVLTKLASIIDLVERFEDRNIPRDTLLIHRNN
eukprot:COSAG06_NODE_40713_length_399_cov_1.006667_1_plen_41_part_01